MNIWLSRFIHDEVCFLLQAWLLLRRLDDLKERSSSTRESMEINEADFRWQRHILSSEQPPWDPSSSNMTAEHSPDISISITTETGQTTLDLETGDLGLGQGHIIPDECGEDARFTSPFVFGGQEGVRCETSLELTSKSDTEEGRDVLGEVVGPEAKGRSSGDQGGGPPDVVQRSHALVYPDITNFLSVESRTKSHHGGSRYSESNFR